MTDDHHNMSTAESLLLWLVVALVCFAAAGFVAGLVYPFLM